MCLFGQFTGNCTQTVKRLLAAKGSMLPKKAAYRLFCFLKIPNGVAPWPGKMALKLYCECYLYFILL